jgi:hypothetical protein
MIWILGTEFSCVSGQRELQTNKISKERKKGIERDREREREGPITECRVRRGFVYIYRKLGWSGRVGGQ